MDKKEQQILDAIKEQSKEMNIPKSLEPDVIEEKLSGKRKKRGWNKGAVAGLLAASFVAICGISLGIFKNVTKEKTTADNYEEVYDYIQEYWKQESGGLVKSEGEMAEKVMTESASDQTPTASAEHSATNVRQEGVDEADVVKTDGTYLYVLKDNGASIAIVAQEGGELKKQGEIVLEEQEVGVEFFIKGKTLVLISGTAGGNHGVMPLDGARAEAQETEIVTSLLTYDISDVSTPKKEGEVTQSGYYTTARMEGDVVYLFSRYDIDFNAKSENIATYVPSINGTLISEQKISMPTENAASVYEVMTAIDTKQPEEIKDSRAVLSTNAELYMSNENIYWYDKKWNDNQTTIQKFSYKEGNIEPVAQGKVKGLIDDVFSIDEYNGYLRIVTTYKETNGVYIFDGDLEQTGAIEGLAKEERVRSARFMGDTGYFVTFKETDPLFSVDLSNPRKPQILGALKIPGFSEYLHFYGENQLLGIGMEVDEKTLSTGGVKLSMFDISDKKDVQEAQKYVMKNMYSAQALYDYKAVLIDVEKNLIGFSGFEGSGENYYVFSYDEKEGFIPNMKEVVNGSGGQATRGVFIEDFLYVIKGNIIEQYSLKDYIKIGDLIL